MPAYIMMSCALPKKSLKEIQKMQISFVWGDIDEDKHVHTFKWSTLTIPKMAGGLGLKILVINSETCLLKLGWKFMNGENGLWCDVLRGKYGRGNEHAKYVTTKNNESSLWRNLGKTETFYNKILNGVLVMGIQGMFGMMCGSLQKHLLMPLQITISIFLLSKLWIL
ncbi:unnamed protein product [Lathyrus sativus]|nr:unnamed protein product [Lathyrus sativus]